MIRNQKNIRTFEAERKMSSSRLNIGIMLYEKWTPIKGFEGFYEISSFGRVKRLERVTIDVNGRKLFYKEKIIKGGISRDGYLQVVLIQENGQPITRFVHILVAEAFIPNPYNLPCVNHKDENKKNPRVDNLEWASYSYNNTYGTVLERRKKLPNVKIPDNIEQIVKAYQGKQVDVPGNDHIPKRHQKYVIQIDEEGNEIARYKSVSEAGRANGFDRHLFSNTKSTRGIKIIKDKIFFIEEKENEYIPVGHKGPRHDLKGNTAKPICQYSKEGDFIQEFDSAKDAAIFLGSINKSPDIINCCNGKLKSAHGFLWRHKGDKAPEPFINKSKTKIDQYTIDGRYIQSFESIRDAINYLGQGSPTGIGNCLAGRAHSAFGYKWKYAND